VDAGILGSAFGLGAALGLLPGPVQLVLLTEATRGGVRRGFTAMAGANGTFGVELLALAAGLSILAPSDTALRALKVVGGGFLLFLAWDAFRSAVRPADAGEGTAPGRTPFVKGVLAVILNPGAWVFLATTASALFATAVSKGGRPLSLSSAVAMVAGVACVDGSMVLLGGGVRRFHTNVARWLTPILACGLAAFGVLLVVEGLRG
jgi:threonine/homoserine/homoserine lactone efflux protein